MRLKRREVDEKSRKVQDLERQIQLEEDRTGIRDRGHFSYSTFAKAAAQRRDNLKTSTDGLRDKLAAAVRERDDTAEQLARAAAQAEHRDDTHGHRLGRRRDRTGTAALR